MAREVSLELRQALTGGARALDRLTPDELHELRRLLRVMTAPGP